MSDPSPSSLRSNDQTPTDLVGPMKEERCTESSLAQALRTARYMYGRMPDDMKARRDARLVGSKYVTRDGVPATANFLAEKLLEHEARWGVRVRPTRDDVVKRERSPTPEMRDPLPLLQYSIEQGDGVQAPGQHVQVTRVSSQQQVALGIHPEAEAQRRSTEARPSISKVEGGAEAP